MSFDDFDIFREAGEPEKFPPGRQKNHAAPAESIGE